MVWLSRYGFKKLGRDHPVLFHLWDLWASAFLDFAMQKLLQCAVASPRFLTRIPALCRPMAKRWHTTNEKRFRIHPHLFPIDMLHIMYNGINFFEGINADATTGGDIGYVWVASDGLVYPRSIHTQSLAIPLRYDP